MTDFRINVIVDPAQAKSGSKQAVNELQKVEDSADHLSKALLKALELSGIPKSLRQLESLARSLDRINANLNQVVLGQDRLVGATESLAAAQAREALAAQQAAGANAALAGSARQAADAERSAAAGAEELGEKAGEAEKKVFDLGGALKSALAFVGITFGIRQLVELSDAFTNVQNRLRVVTEGEQQLADVTAQLAAISDRTRSSFQGTVELYSRVGLASRELGINQEQLINFTESLNQAIILSGASSTEAQAGLIQLSQGLASGALRGDELRSVLEQLPAVADVIAKELKVTRGELRAMGQEGKITADIVLSAFAHARDELSERFGKTVPTIGQAFTVLRNDIINFIGGLNEATGASALASKTILLVAENIKLVSVAVVGLSTVIIASLVQKAIPALLIQLTALKAAVLSNPLFIAGGVAAAAVTYLVIQLAALDEQIKDVNAALKDVESQGFSDFGRVGDQILKTQKSMESLQKVLAKDPTNEAAIRQLERMSEKLEELKGKSKAYVDEAKKAKDENAKLTETFEKASEALRKEAELLLLSNSEREIGTKLLAIEQKLKSAGVDVTPQQREELELQLQNIQKLTEQNKVLEEIRGPELERQERMRVLKQLLDEARISQEEYNKAVVTQGDVQAPEAPFPTTPFEVPEGFQFVPPTDKFAEALAQLQQEGELLKLSNEERAIQNQLLSIQQQLLNQGRPLNEAELKSLEDQLRLNQATNEEKRQEERLLQQIQGPRQAAQEALATLNRLQDQGKISAEEYAEALKKIESGLGGIRTVSEGFQDGLEKSQKKLTDLAGLAESAVSNGFGAAEDAIAQFAATGKASVSDFVNSVLSDLARLLARQALLSLFGGGEAGGGAGLLSSFFGGGKAAGGDVDPGQAFLVGERGPEIFQPDSAGTIIPNDATQAMIEAGGSGGGTTVVQAPAPVVNVKVENYSDPKEALDALDTPEGTQKVVNIIRKNPNVIRRT